MLTGLLVAVLGGFAWLVLSQPREPVYQGKSLSVWLQNYVRPPKFVGELPGLRETDEAVRQMGTNAIPTLSRMLRARDASWKVWLMTLAKKQRVIRIHFVPATERHILALQALNELDHDAAKAGVPALIELYDTSPDNAFRLAVVSALGRIGSSERMISSPPALRLDPFNATNNDPDPLLTKALVPPLLRGATNASSAELRAQSLYVLTHIHAEPSVVLPVLVNALNDSSSTVRREALFRLVAMPAEPKLAGLVVPALTRSLADSSVPTEFTAMALAKYGLEAKPAVPALIKFIQDHPNDSPSFDNPTRIVVSSLKQIDPEAAAKAGVK